MATATDSGEAVRPTERYGMTADVPRVRVTNEISGLLTYPQPPRPETGRVLDINIPDLAMENIPGVGKRSWRTRPDR